MSLTLALRAKLGLDNITPPKQWNQGPSRSRPCNRNMISDGRGKRTRDEDDEVIADWLASASQCRRPLASMPRACEHSGHEPLGLLLRRRHLIRQIPWNEVQLLDCLVNLHIQTWHSNNHKLHTPALPELQDMQRKWNQVNPHQELDRDKGYRNILTMKTLAVEMRSWMSKL
jgi:hypothetical protein